MDGAAAGFNAKRLLQRAGRIIADAIIPPQCLVCRSGLQEPSALCPQCWGGLQFIEEPCCDRLGTPFAYDEGEGAVSAAATAEPPDWHRARAAVGFNDAARGLVHALKYRDRHEAALLMARLTARAGVRLFDGAHAIIPIPLHRYRLWTRRYNQSALLGQRVAAAAGLAFRPDLMTRVKRTRQQVGLDHSARRRNVRRAFAVPERFLDQVSGRNFVLVDDVMTTGATAAACAEALLKAGAARVDVLVFALVLEPKRLHI
jgi:ComF family protein